MMLAAGEAGRSKQCLSHKASLKEATRICCVGLRGMLRVSHHELDQEIIRVLCCFRRLIALQAHSGREEV